MATGKKPVVTYVILKTPQELCLVLLELLGNPVTESYQSVRKVVLS